MSPVLQQILQRWQSAWLGLLLMAGWLVNEHYQPWAGFYSEAFAVFAGAVVVLVTLLLRGSTALRPLPLMLLACAAIPWVQWAAGLILYRGDAVLASLYLVGIALCVWAGGATAEVERARLTRALALAFLVFSLLGSAIAAYQWLGLSGLGVWVAQFPAGMRPGGNLGQPNHLATLLCCGLASLTLLHARREIPRLLVLLFLVVLLAGLALTQSRVPWVVVAVVLAWMLARRPALTHPLRLHAGVAVLALLAYVLAFWWVSHASTALLNALELPDTSRLEVGRRPQLWAQWIYAIRLAPWEGYGWLQGTMTQAAAVLAKPGLEYSFYAHNLALDLLAWNGVPLGLTIALALTGWYFLMGLRASGAEQWFRFAVVTAFSVHAMLEYPHAYAYFLVPVALLAGQLEAEAGAFPRALRVPAGVLWGGSLVTLATALVVMHDYVRIESDTRLLRAQLLRIGGLRESEPPSDIRLLDNMLDPLRAGRLHIRRGMPSHDIDALAKVTVRFPTSFHVQRLALALALNGHSAEATTQMRRLFSTLGPFDYRPAALAMQQRVADEYPELSPLAETWLAWAAHP